MKAITLLCLTVSLTSVAFADEIKASKVKDYIKKNDRCVLAIGLSNPNLPVSGDPMIADDVLCISDLSISEGTVNEAKGCGLSILNVSTGKMRKASFNAMMNPNTVEHAVVKKVSCASGGVEKLLESNFESVYGHGPKIKEFLSKGPSGSRATLIFTENDSYKSKYESSLKAMGKDNTAKKN